MYTALTDSFVSVVKCNLLMINFFICKEGVQYKISVLILVSTSATDIQILNVFVMSFFGTDLVNYPESF